jgi:peptidoglycan/xylan/chitin deacetylase (PgdA/CDA1 family)
VLDASVVLLAAVSLFAGGWRGARSRRRRWRPALAGLFAVLVGVGSVLVGLSVVWKLSSARAAVFGPTVLRIDTESPEVALTFDDGPTEAYTEDILDLLDVYDARATFFVNGDAIERHPRLGRAILERGHQLGNHSWSHPRLIFRSDARLHAEVDETDRVLRAIGVTGSIPFRPPYGKRLLDLHRVLGDRPVVLWDVEPESFPDVAGDPERLAAHVLERVRPGSIVLLHAMFESRRPTREALPLILGGLRERGLRPVTLRALQANGAR